MPHGLTAQALGSRAMDALVAQIETTMLRMLTGGRDKIVGPMAQAHLATGGKRLRARLAAAATCALGGSHDTAVAWGAACELAHNATLVHDDLQDGDTHRRGQLTTWKRFGMAQAINVGDLLFMLPFMAIGQAKLSGAVHYQLCEALADRMVAVIDGQALECDMTARRQIDLAAYERMIRGKTGALFELPVYGAALAAGYDGAAAQACTAPFAPLGMLFQMQDDLLDLYGDKGRDAPGSDLKEGKVSALVVQHVRLHPQDASWLRELLHKPRHSTSQQEIEVAIDRFVSGGAQRAVLDVINQAACTAQATVTPTLAPLLQQLIDRVLAPIVHLR